MSLLSDMPGYSVCAQYVCGDNALLLLSFSTLQSSELRHRTDDSKQLSLLYAVLTTADPNTFQYGSTAVASASSYYREAAFPSVEIFGVGHSRRCDR